MKILRVLAIDCLLVVVAGITILHNANLIERQYPISAQSARDGVADPLCPVHEPPQMSNSIFPVVHAQSLVAPPACPLPPNCDFSLSNGGSILAQKCDALTVNRQTFTATITPSLGQCPINPTLSNCSFTGDGNVHVDAGDSSDNITTYVASCQAAYYAYPQVGTKVAGNYAFSMTIQWALAYVPPTTHDVGGQVQCP
jgi:hypothetical protein